MARGDDIWLEFVDTKTNKLMATVKNLEKCMIKTLDSSRAWAVEMINAK